MDTLIVNLDRLIAGAYLVLFISYIHSFITARVQRGNFSLVALPAVVLLHLTKLIIQGVTEGHCPLVGIGETFSFTAFSIAVIYSVLERSQKYYSTGALFIGVVFASQLASVVAVILSPPPLEGIGDIPIGFHAPIAVIATASFATSAVYGVIYLFLYGRLRKKHLDAHLRLVPSLEAIERMQTLSSKIGLVLMALALMSGLVIGVVYKKVFALYDPKIIVSLIVLGIFGYGVFGGWRHSLPGKRKAAIAIAGIVIAIASMTVVRLVVPTFHRF